MNKLTLLTGGCNSQIYAYGQGAEQVVLKVVSASNRKEQKHLKNQFQILQNLHHRNVVKSLRYRQNVGFPGNKTDKQLQKSNTNNILVLEHASKGNLLNYLRKQKPEINTKRKAFKSIAQGLAYLHSKGIAHRDLKLQNILVFEQNGGQIIKISDFGFASHFQQEKNIIKSKEYKGTKKGYMAPQIHQCAKHSQNEYDVAKADIFALGVILFSLVFEHLPFEYAVNSNTHYKQIIQKQFSKFWDSHNVSKFQLQKGYRLEQLKDLFQRMVSFRAQQRPSIEQVLGHAWLSECIFNKQN